jgi:hypothetical protein
VISCSTIPLPDSAPKPHPIPECDIVAVEGGIPYLYCHMTDKPADKWRVKIDSTFWAKPEKYVCTTDQGYAQAYKDGQALSRWMEKNCAK